MKIKAKIAVVAAVFAAIAAHAQVIFTDDFQADAVANPAPSPLMGGWVFDAANAGNANSVIDSNEHRIFDAPNSSAYINSRGWISNVNFAYIYKDLGVGVANTNYLVKAFIDAETSTTTSTIDYRIDLFAGPDYASAVAAGYVARVEGTEFGGADGKAVSEYKRLEYVSGALTPTDHLYLQITRKNSNASAFMFVDDVEVSIVPAFVPEVAITSFSASDAVVNAGDSVTLSWGVTNATAVVLNPGELDVTGTTSTVVTVEASTTYELIASNSAGSVTNSLSITAIVPRPWESDPSLIATTNGTVQGEDDSDQAGPMYGQGITVNIGSTVSDAEIPQTVALQQVSFQRTSSTTGIGATVAYLHVYDDFAVDAAGVPTTIGNLIAVSTNTVNHPETQPLETLTWYFDNDEIDKGTLYHYVMATDTVAATVENSANLTTTGFELNPSNPYSGGQAWRANGDSPLWDLEFEVVVADVSPAAPVADLSIAGPIDSGSKIILSWSSEAGKPYGVETSTNLVLGGWQPVVSGLEGTGGIMSVTNAVGADESFYRVISE